MTDPIRSAIQPRLGALLAFLRSETGGGAILIAASVVAFAWANSAAGGAYQGLLAFALGPLSVLSWIDDGLMTLFFLLVGLEIRREMTKGEFASLSHAAAPAIAALGGMAAPALIFIALNHGDEAASRGWAVPVATDIAFSLAVMRVLGARVGVALKLFLTALAILDDLGAIVIIALFYTADLVPAALSAAALVWLALLALNRMGARAVWPYLAGGLLLWGWVLRSGVHPTLAGVALALVVPMSREPGQTICAAERLERGLAPWVGYLILPLFGLANAGLRLDGLSHGVLLHPLVLGAALGLFLGKPIGVFGATMAATGLGLARLPEGITRLQLLGMAILCGIGFTMSLFIGHLAFRGSDLETESKLAVLAGSLLSTIAGLAVLAWATRAPGGKAGAAPDSKARPQA